MRVDRDAGAGVAVVVVVKLGEGRCEVCERTFRYADVGRPRRFCGDACRQQRRRERTAEQLAIMALDHLRASPDRVVLSTLAALDRSSLVMLLDGLRHGSHGL